MSIACNCIKKCNPVNSGIKAIYFIDPNDVKDLGKFLMGKADFKLKRKYGKRKRIVHKYEIED